MVKEYVTLLDAYAETTVLRSRFLAYLYHIESEEEAAEKLSALRKKHYDATHVCYAYCSDVEGHTVKFSDDGEPSSTAGAPILSIIDKGGYRQVLIAVVRYFGGTKLGVGGLVRAYTDAAGAAAEKAVRQRRVLSRVYSVETDYNLYGRICAAAGEAKLTVTEYGDTVKFLISIPAGSDLIKKFTDVTNGKTEFIERGEKYEIY